MADVVGNQTAKQKLVKKNTTGTVLAGLASAGDRISLALSQCTTATTVGANGSASALPTPVGYVEVLIGTTVVKIPYFNV